MKCEETLRTNKGVAGLSILITLITFLFVIGLIIMIFTLMGAGIKDSDTVKASDTSASTTQNVVTLIDGASAPTLTACASQIEGEILTITLINETTGGVVASSNYTTSGCTVTATADSEASGYNNSAVNVTYTYTFAGVSYTVMNDTMSGISGAVDWYDIFIVIGAMVVLILLTVIIIVAIRGSGLMAGEGNSSSNGNIGSA